MQKRLHRHEHTHTHTGNRKQQVDQWPFIDHECVWKMQPSKKMKEKLLLLCTFQARLTPQLEVGCLSDVDKTSRHAEVQSWLFIATQDFICTKLPAADDELQFSC